MTLEKIGEPKECAEPKNEGFEFVDTPATDKELVDFYAWHINFPCKTETPDGTVDIRKFWITRAQELNDKKIIKDPAEEKRLKDCLHAYRDELEK